MELSYRGVTQRSQEVNLVRPGKTYLHTLALKQWLLRKERSFEEQDKEEIH